MGKLKNEGNRAGSSNFFEFKNTSHLCEELIILSSVFCFYV